MICRYNDKCLRMDCKYNHDVSLSERKKLLKDRLSFLNEQNRLQSDFRTPIIILLVAFIFFSNIFIQE